MNKENSKKDQNDHKKELNSDKADRMKIIDVNDTSSEVSSKEKKRHLSKKGLLGLDISDDKLRFVYLEKEGRKYELKKAGKSGQKLDLSADGSIFNAVNEILKDKEINPKEIFVTISKDDTVLFQMVLPEMNASETEEALTGELEKIPSLSLQKYDFIYKSYVSPNDKRKVIFAAILQDALDLVIDEVRKTETRFNSIEISPLNFKEILNGKRSSNKAEIILIVHDKDTYMTVIYKNRYLLSYKIDSGSDQIKASVNIKEGGGAFDGWAEEVRRVIKSFILENRATPIKKVWLVWDNNEIIDFDKIIGKKLGLPTEAVSIDKLKGISAQNASLNNPINVLPLVPIFCHLNRIKTDFPLDHFFRKYKLKSYLLKTAAFTSIAFFLLLLLFSQFNMRLVKKTHEMSKKTGDIVTQRVRAEEESSSLFRQYSLHNETREHLLYQAAFVQNLNRISWSEVFSEFAKELPEGLSLTSFNFNDKGLAQIRGSALNMNAIAEVMRRIEDSTILENGKFSYLKETKQQDSALFEFAIDAKLKSHKKKETKGEQDKENDQE